MTELTELLASYLTSLGVEEIKLSTKKHIRRNLQTEFGDVLLFENLLETASVFIVPANLSPLQVAKYITTILLEKKKNRTMQASLLGAQTYTGLLLTFAKLFKKQKTRCHGLHAHQISPRGQ